MKRLRAPAEAADIDHAGEIIAAAGAHLEARVVGQRQLRESLLLALLTGGHILLESAPGLAKTTAAATLAEAIDGTFSRIQCTPDLMPSDIIGSQVYDARAAAFSTRLGPVHANIVLLDEINRAGAKTQSAMLEAMQEKQVTIGGERFELPRPFLVLATQNPLEHEGTYRLPEAQLDRFMFKEVLDYPSPEEEKEILRRVDAGVFDSPAPQARISRDDVKRLVDCARSVYIDPALTDYLVRLVQVTRHPHGVLHPALAAAIDCGASPRASIAMTAGARALALVRGRAFVIPEDVKAIAHRVLRHRIVLGFEADADGLTTDTVVDALLTTVPTP
ncbi:AAA family ATPase [Sediminivirga luteola]|uniref:AAA family ATPase n=1 Tax=Sediminivirga luteola TaxID=1774748 RepID=UPI001F56B0AA|nr:MoxR family ATPase [Sediminivirga luteola]